MEYEFPNYLKYTSTHEWVHIEDTAATVGITDFAQHHLGDVVFVELPEVGIAFDRGSNVGEIESVKAVGDLNMPLSGEIMEINEKLANNPELVNSSPFKDGWMMKIRISHPIEIDELLPVNEYILITEKEAP